MNLNTILPAGIPNSLTILDLYFIRILSNCNEYSFGSIDPYIFPEISHLIESGVRFSPLFFHYPSTDTHKAKMFGDRELTLCVLSERPSSTEGLVSEVAAAAVNPLFYVHRTLLKWIAHQVESRIADRDRYAQFMKIFESLLHASLVLPFLSLPFRSLLPSLPSPPLHSPQHSTRRCTTYVSYMQLKVLLS